MWQSSLDSEKCYDFIERCRDLPPLEATIFNDSQSDHRNSTVRWVNNDPEIKDMLWWHVKQANRFAFNVDVTDTCDVQFTEYSSANSGKYDWHHDVDWTSNHAFDRKLSVVVQLSDPKYYEGADFEFAEVESPEKNALKCKGTVLVFPSYLTHRVTEITSGTRYSLVAWFEGPRWR